MDKDSKGKKIIFISHSKKDTWIAKQIAYQVENHGGKALLDEFDVKPEDDFSEKIRKLIKSSHELVVLFTPWAFDRLYIWTEIGAAWIIEIPINVFLSGISIKDFLSNYDVPIYVKKGYISDLNDIEKYLNQLKKNNESSYDADE